MKRFVVFLALGFVSVALTVGCAGGSLSSTRAMLAKPIAAASYELPEVERWQLSNGLEVILLKDDELPFIRGNVYFRAGGLWNIEEKPGLLELLTSTMRIGGAGDLKSEAFEQRIIELAAAISISIGSEYGTVSFEGLSSDAREVIELVTLMLTAPRFESDKIDLWKKGKLEGIRRRKDDPFGVAKIAYKQLHYLGTPYGKVLSERDVASLSRADLKRALRSYVQPTDGFLVLSGPLSRAEIEPQLEETLVRWKGKRAFEDLNPPLPQSRAKPGIYFIRGDYQQSSVIMGHSGPKRLPDDYIEIALSNEIFGSGGFSSLLLRKIREELGLVYWASGSTRHGIPVGSSTLAFQTKAPSTSDAIRESLGLIEKVKSGDFASSELELAKRASVNSFVFRFDSPLEIANRFALLEILGYPEDYDTSFVPKVSAVDKTGVAKAFQKYWDPSDFIVVVVGNDDSYTSLESFIASTGKEYGLDSITEVQFDTRLQLGDKRVLQAIQ